MASTKPKIDRAKFTIEKKEGETVYKHMNEVGENNLDFKCRFNKNSTIYILDYFASMSVDKCEDCKIITGPLTGSIFIRNCKNCSISTIARQVRLRDCENLKIFTYCPTDPAVESSFNILFAPYNSFFPHLKELFVKGGLNSQEANRYTTPHDFTKDAVLGDGAQHFGVLDKNDFIIEEVRDGEDPIEEMFDGYGQSEEYVVEKGGFTPSNNNNNFDPFGNNNNNINTITDTANNNDKQNDDFFNVENNDNNQINNSPFDFVSDVPLGMNTNNNNNAENNMKDMFSNNTENNNNNMKDMFNNISDNNKVDEIDQEEIERQNLRRQEAEVRAKRIRELQEKELQMKNELREKAMEYLENFNKARLNKIEENKKNNNYNEEKMQQDKEELKQLLSSGKHIDSWKKVTENIDIKASDYKGSKDISRMREAIINRKNENK